MPTRERLRFNLPMNPLSRNLEIIRGFVRPETKALLLTIARKKRSSLNAVVRSACEEYVQLHTPNTLDLNALTPGTARLFAIMEKAGRPLSVKDLRRLANLSQAGVYKHLVRLMEKGRVKKAAGLPWKYAIALEEMGPEGQ